MQRRTGRRFLSCLVISCVCLLTTSLAVSAGNNSDYTLVEGNVRMPIAETYTLDKVINMPASNEEDTLGFNAPEDLFLNSQGYLFVVDSGNSRIVKMDTSGNQIAVFTGQEDNPLKNPKGIFADDEGNMYIADTGNNRIVHLSADGSFVESFGRPSSDKLGSDFIFDPTKVIVTDTGYIYALKGQYLICIDGYNNFRGYVGQSKIAYSLSEVLIRMFGSEKQIAAISTRVAASYTNIMLDNEGMILASTLDSRDGEIKRLNAVGENIYRNYGASSEFSLFDGVLSYAFDDLSFTFGDYTIEKPYFCDVTMHDNGIISALDSNTCKIFQYDSEGNLLAIFGSSGNTDGSFQNPCSIVSDDEGKLYVLDKGKNNIQIFHPTSFIQSIYAAVEQYHLGDYEKAKSIWQDVLGTCENYQMANIGLAKAAFKQGDWKEAMVQYELASDRKGYSEAFAKYRHSILRNYFLPVCGVAIVAMVLFVWVVFCLKKSTEHALNQHYTGAPNRYSVGNMLLCGVGTVFHPFDTFSMLKGSRKNLKPAVGIIILLAVLGVRIFFVYNVHYPLVKLDPRDANILLEIARMILPVITFALACHMITAIVGGEATLSEIFTACCYSMVPYVLVTFVLTGLSHIMCRSEDGLFTFIINATWVVVFLLFFLNIYLLNNYTVKKTLAVALLSLFTMVLIWIVILMVIALSVQLGEFVTGIIREITIVNM